MAGKHSSHEAALFTTVWSCLLLLQMEMFQIIFLTVAVSAQVSPPTVNTVTTNRAIPTAKLTLEPALAVFYLSEKVTLKCEIEGSSDDWSYKWHKNKGFLHESKSPLEITLKSKDDSGEYTCQPFIKDRVTTEMSSAVTLQVNAIPTAKLTLEPALAVFYPSEKVTLKCEIEGSSDDWSYKWHKNKGFLHESKSPLEITLKSKDDSGEYTCQRFIKDRVTTEMSSAVTLQVNAIPTAKLTLEPALAVFYPSEKVTLKCEIEGSSDDWSYKLHKNKGFLHESKSPLEITLKSKDDSGEYTCQPFIKDRVTTEMSSAVTLKINAIPTAKLTLEPALAVFYPSEKVTLKCEIEGSSDDWSYKWHKNKGFLHESKSPLEITLKSKDDSGEYTCQRFIKDRVTTEMSSAVTLQVNAIPTAKLTLEPALAVFYPSEKVTLKCEIEGSSDDWSYKWHKNKGFLHESKSPLEITLKSKDDSGEYTCQRFIKDRVTTEMSSAVTLQVNETPRPKLTADPNWTEFFPNETITLTCGFDGNSDGWSFEWLKINETLKTSSTLTITAKPSDSGRYSCKGKLRSVVSQQSDAFQLNVKDQWPKPNLTQSQNVQVFYKGETITFNCKVEVRSLNWEYLFFRDSVQIRADTSNSFSIQSAQVSHSGKYLCQVKRRTLSSGQSDVRTVTVKEIPQAQLNSEWKDAFPGETVSLQCVIPGVSENWIYMWFRNETTVSSGPESDTNVYGNTLSLSVKPHHTGLYTMYYVCQAQLERRSVKSAKSTQHSLNLYGTQPTIILKQDPQYPKIYTGEQVKLKCSIQEQTSKWAYQWKKDESVQGIQGDTYTIQSATLSHNGLYTCHISRNGVTFSSESKKCTIIEPPQPKLSIESEWKMFYRSEKITLKCSINKNPNAWCYEWYRNITKLSEEKDTLLINSADISHNGSYKCKAKHQQRSPVTTSETQALQIHIYDKTPKPDIKEHPSFEFFYTDERIHLDCNMSGDGWEYHWYKDSKPTQPSITNTNYTINSASLHHTGVYKCEAKRGDFSIYSEPLKVEVQARLSAALTLGTELSDIMAGSVLTLRCEVSDGKEWNYTWSENGQELNESSHTLKVKATEDTIKNEFKCRGKRTVRPLYSSWSEGFVANNTVFKRKILLAISGFFICCIVILIIGCIVLKITRKPVKKETLCEDLFISMADSKNQATTPLMEYMENKPTENESEEKEELIMDHISVTHVDGVIKGEDSPSAEANGLTSFKGT